MKLTMKKLAEMKNQAISMTMKKAILKRIGEIAEQGKQGDERMALRGYRHPKSSIPGNTQRDYPAKLRHGRSKNRHPNNATIQDKPQSD